MASGHIQSHQIVFACLHGYTVTAPSHIKHHFGASCKHASLVGFLVYNHSNWVLCQMYSKFLLAFTQKLLLISRTDSTAGHYTKLNVSFTD